MISLVATDLDGTLLNSDSQVSRENREAIALARANGVTTIAATARSARSVASIGRDAGLGPIAICANGSIGYDIETGELLWHHRLPGGDILDLLAELRRRAPGILFAAEQHKEFFSEPHFLRNEVVITGFTHVDHIETVLGEGATKVICRHPVLSQQEIVALIAEASNGGVATSPGSISWVEILPKGISKASGLRDVTERLGVALESTAAIGDHLNDLPMLREAGLAAAVANAHPETLATADLVVRSNDEHGVADLLSQIEA